MQTSAHQNKLRNFFDSFAGQSEKYRQRHSYYWQSIIDYCSYYFNESLSVLEIGCGTGDFLNAVPAKRKVGTDISPEMIRIARAKYSNIEFKIAGNEIVELNEKFDVIVCSNLIGYLEDVSLFFDSLHTVAHSRTKIIITYYNKSWEPFFKIFETLGIRKKYPLQNWLTTSDIENFLYLSNFRTYKKQKELLLPMYIPLLSWFCNKFLARLPIFNWFTVNKYLFAHPIHKNISKEEADSLHSVTIVIPARNESGNIERAILEMPRFAKEQEILFIEGNSTDDTYKTILENKEKYQHQYNISVLQQDGKGKGDAVRKAFDYAKGDVLMILDADLTVLPADLPKFYYALAAGKADFINGSRLVYPMEKDAMRTLNYFGNLFFSKMFTWLLQQPIKDTLCGTKVMFKKDYEQLKINRKFFGDFDPFGDFDLIFGAYKLNLPIIDIPISYKERSYGETNISRFKHGLLLLRMCWFAIGKIKFI